ncbi:hypothetical protein KPH14_004834 [Odynerus spinipes]|uniref:Pheromone biosynthesis activating neuropeptide n=1 Tax=Odynerus spinipes TaxID=1348599 RepID=A0AAD9VPQ3_9HYME|nr:hypothetical protein KPH14_004834 [Odynerus spinipes]
MSDLRSSLALILLIFAATLHQVRNEKTNCRRALGLVAYPRTGRSSEMTDFHRSARTFGFIHYPRTGRSDLPALYIGANRKHDLGSTLNLEFLSSRDAELDPTFDPDYEEFYPGSPTITRHADKVYPAQKQDNSRPYDLGLRGLHNRQGHLLINVPRVGRDNDHEGSTNLL